MVSFAKGDPVLEAECPSCRRKRDNFQAAGLLTFFSGLFTCGVLTPLTLPLTVAFVIISAIKCKDCRLAKKEAKRQKAIEMEKLRIDREAT